MRGNNVTRANNYDEFLKSEAWARFRAEIWERHQGRCHLCGAPGSEVHHLSYDHGLLNPRAVILVCRPCHLIWRGQDPAHLPDDHHLKPTLLRIAYLARCLGFHRGAGSGEEASRQVAMKPASSTQSGPGT
jgi:hypothetical protein